ncbi:50S ribosomal protein L20 [bacterium endosymbiont of Pedicinus badii]|uniref:50S ribosomal protein L20 n=1 Tax=bacterium endosymbiont of Pedicinus badii TaxID=1719126 RepID=UPI0009B95AF6|nr:50S ribosomal protein L20 [bacterium endosymbiont of Pedicinus badii]OQM34386.1 50S ribosomal protein L20 [bacterium endosymbiont of Pedicinus badii]
MARVKRGKTAHARHKKILKLAKGYYGSRSRTYRSALQSVTKSRQYSYRDRRNKKREFRKLWIIRIALSCKNSGISYSKFIFGLKQLSIKINRKILSDMAIRNKTYFRYLLEKTKKHLSIQ